MLIPRSRLFLSPFPPFVAEVGFVAAAAVLVAFVVATELGGERNGLVYFRVVVFNEKGGGETYVAVAPTTVKSAGADPPAATATLVPTLSRARVWVGLALVVTVRPRRSVQPSVTD